MKPRDKKEYGVSDIVILAVTLPILMMLLAGALDLARGPLAKDRLQQALGSGAFGAEQFAFAQSKSPMLDVYTPAGNNLCSVVAPVGDCEVKELSGKQAFLGQEVAQALSQGACELARQALKEDASKLFNYNVDKDGGLQFALIRLNVDAGTGAIGSVETVYTSDACGTAFSTAESGGVDTASVAKNLGGMLKSLKSNGAGAWFVQDAYDVTGADKWITGRKPWLPSYWLVGVGHLKVRFLLGNFFGESRTVVDYFIRPFTVPAGMQKGVMNG
jgi:hypothetical protein